MSEGRTLTLLVAKRFGILDRHLEGREHILDRGRSIIDAYAFSMMRWGIKLLPGGLEGYPNVACSRGGRLTLGKAARA